MKLSECEIGIVVQMEDDDEKIGHVTGLMKNSTSEIVPVIHFADEVSPRGVHRVNLIKLKDKEIR